MDDTLAATLRRTLIGKVRAFLAEQDMGEATFGLRAVGDSRFVRRLEDGENVTLATVAKAETFMANPPTNRRRRSAASAEAHA